MVKYRKRANVHLDNRLFVALDVISEDLDVAKNRILDEALVLWLRTKGYELSDFEDLTEKLGYLWNKLYTIEELKGFAGIRQDGGVAKGVNANRSGILNADKKYKLDKSMSIIRKSRKQRIKEEEENK